MVTHVVAFEVRLKGLDACMSTGTAKMCVCVSFHHVMVDPPLTFEGEICPPDLSKASWNSGFAPGFIGFAPGFAPCFGPRI